MLENDEERESCDSGVLGGPARKDEHIRARATLATENSWELLLATASVSVLFFCIYFTTAWERASRSRPPKCWGMFSTLSMFVCLSEKVDREQEQIEKWQRVTCCESQVNGNINYPGGVQHSRPTPKKTDVRFSSRRFLPVTPKNQQKRLSTGREKSKLVIFRFVQKFLSRTFHQHLHTRKQSLWGELNQPTAHHAHTNTNAPPCGRVAETLLLVTYTFARAKT